jgi:hypothetical protein
MSLLSVKGCTAECKRFAGISNANRSEPDGFLAKME